MVTQSAAGYFLPVERGVFPRDDRPRVRVGGRFACDVMCVEFGEGGVDVVEIECDCCPEQLVGVDLNDEKGLDLNPVGLPSRPEP